MRGKEGGRRRGRAGTGQGGEGRTDNELPAPGTMLDDAIEGERLIKREQLLLAVQLEITHLHKKM